MATIAEECSFLRISRTEKKQQNAAKRNNSRSISLKHNIFFHDKYIDFLKSLCWGVSLKVISAVVKKEFEFHEYLTVCEFFFFSFALALCVFAFSDFDSFFKEFKLKKVKNKKTWKT